MARLSVIIPALNEAGALPGLLDALLAQARPPDEIVVADAGSRDGTPDRARERGAIVVPGGRPGPGRNAGARAASGDLFLFLDADVLPGPEFVGDFVKAFERAEYATATSLITALSDSLADRILVEATNLYLQIVQPFSPHAPGFCILVRRDIHQAIGGFDESVKLAEDHDYVQRAAEHGDFGVVASVRLPVSMRRLEKEGLTRLAVKYLWCEMHALAGKPIYSTPFEYEFGAFATGGPAGGRRLVDIEQLREQLGRFADPLQRLSAGGRSRLDRLMRPVELLDEQLEAARSKVEAARERFQLSLDAPDLRTLNRYLHRRQALLRLTGRPLREAINRLQNLPLQETLRLLDATRLRSRWGADSPREPDERES